MIDIERIRKLAGLAAQDVADHQYDESKTPDQVSEDKDEVAKIQAQIDELEDDIGELDFGSASYDSADAKLQDLHNQLDRAKKKQVSENKDQIIRDAEIMDEDEFIEKYTGEGMSKSEAEAHWRNVNESVDREMKELSEEPNEGNEFTGELEKARKAGKKEFEVDGKKYKVKESAVCEACGADPCICEACNEESLEEITETPTMDTTQLVTLLKNAGLSEEVIQRKLAEWANTPEGVGEIEPTEHGDAYDFAQSVNLSLKRYLDAQDMKVQVSEHTIEGMKALYEAKKKSK